jgi:NAD+ kinase
MPHTATSVLIVLKTDNRRAVALGEDVEAWLRERGVEVRIDEDLAGPSRPTAGRSHPGCDLILVLGGDGTFINVARVLLPSGIPLLGLNLGKVGFLAEVPASGWREALADVLEHGFQVDRRLVMEFEVRREGQLVRSGSAVNELVVSRGCLARLVRIAVSCRGERVASLRADGLIAATPTGSTAYNVSAGGPVVHPSLEVFCLTPVCPFLNDMRPLVLPGDSEFSVRIEEAYGDLFLTEDGQSGGDLASGDEVVIRRGRADLLVASRESDGYFAKLRAKGFITEGVG